MKDDVSTITSPIA